MVETYRLDEKQLLKEIAGGDQDAFKQLFNSYHQMLGAFIFGITRSREHSEEVVLDVFLKIWITREALAEVKNFKAYLFIVSRNAAISSLRKIIRERKQREQWTKDLPVNDSGESNTVEPYLSLIDEAINNLSPQRKKIYILSREKGLKYDQIATQLGISAFTVRAHIQQGVSAIVEYVKSRMGSELILICAYCLFF
jgi:RNA polymerase sigma-70 factor (ECF subfamily)